MLPLPPMHENGGKLRLIRVFIYSFITFRATRVDVFTANQESLEKRTPCVTTISSWKPGLVKSVGFLREKRERNPPIMQWLKKFSQRQRNSIQKKAAIFSY
jgi:hypothetical protein